MSSALNPITRNQPGEHSLVSGPLGSRKTTVAKFVARDLEREVIDYRWGYVNCLARSTRAQTLYKLASDAGVASDLRVRGHAPSVFVDRLAAMDRQFVGIVDEVNVLEDLGTLVELDYLPNVTLILACVDEDDFYADADGTADRPLIADEMFVRTSSVGEKYDRVPGYRPINRRNREIASLCLSIEQRFAEYALCIRYDC